MRTTVGAGRSLGVDLVRAAGIVAIVLGHIWPTRNVFYTWHVPVFFVLTGYLWKDGRPFSGELQRRTRSLVLPYASWLLLVLAVWYPFLASTGRTREMEPGRTLLTGGSALGSPWSAFWFVTALLVATLLVRALQGLSWAAVWAVGLVGLWWATVDPAALRSTWLAAGQALVGVLFVAAGALLRDLRPRVGRPLLVGAPLLAVSFLLGYREVLSYVDLKAGYVGTPVLSAVMAVGISWGLVLVLEGVAPRLHPALAAGPSLLARYGLAVILGHALVLAVESRLGVHRTWWLPLLAIGAPLAVAVAVDGTPAGALLLGNGATGRRRRRPSAAREDRVEAAA